MKNIIYAIAIMGSGFFYSLKSNAQITLDHIVDSTELSLGLAYGFKAVQISPTETKYYVNDTITNTFSLFNLDFTPFISNISVPEPFIQGTDRLQALYITRELFDCDTTNIEYAYYSPGNINGTFRILRTDGTILFQLDSANGPYGYGNMLGGSDVIRPIINTSGGAKLFLQSYSLGYQHVYIYSLCGSLPNDIFDFTEVNQSSVIIFPNPTSSALTFKFNLIDNVYQHELAILDDEGREVNRERINNNIKQSTLDVSKFASGIYHYSLLAKNRVVFTGKFILTK